MIRIRIDEIKVDPQMAPKIDEDFIELMNSAIDGKIPVYFAAIPLALCIPNDADYRPDKHPILKQLIDDYIQQIRDGNYREMIAYQRGAWFVIGDHYIELFAYTKLDLQYVPCWIMGEPESEDIKDLQGPLKPSDVPLIFGIDDNDAIYS